MLTSNNNANISISKKHSFDLLVAKSKEPTSTEHLMITSKKLNQNEENALTKFSISSLTHAEEATSPLGRMERGGDSSTSTLSSSNAPSSLALARKKNGAEMQLSRNEKTTSPIAYSKSISMADISRAEDDNLENGHISNKTNFSYENLNQNFENQDLFDPYLIFISIHRCKYWENETQILKGKLYLTSSEILFKCAYLPYVKLRLKLSNIADIFKIKAYNATTETVLSIRMNDTKSYTFSSFKIPKNVIKNLIIQTKNQSEDQTKMYYDQANLDPNSNRLRLRRISKPIKVLANMIHSSIRERGDTNLNSTIGELDDEIEMHLKQAKTSNEAFSDQVQNIESKSTGKKSLRLIKKQSLTLNDNDTSIESNESSVHTDSEKKFKFKKNSKRKLIINKLNKKAGEQSTNAIKKPDMKKWKSEDQIDTKSILAPKKSNSGSDNLLIKSSSSLNRSGSLKLSKTVRFDETGPIKIRAISNHYGPSTNISSHFEQENSNEKKTFAEDEDLEKLEDTHKSNMLKNDDEDEDENDSQQLEEYKQLHNEISQKAKSYESLMSLSESFDNRCDYLNENKLVILFFFVSLLLLIISTLTNYRLMNVLEQKIDDLL